MDPAGATDRNCIAPFSSLGEELLCNSRMSPCCPRRAPSLSPPLLFAAAPPISRRDNRRSLLSAFHFGAPRPIHTQLEGPLPIQPGFSCACSLPDWFCSAIFCSTPGRLILPRGASVWARYSAWRATLSASQQHSTRLVVNISAVILPPRELVPVCWADRAA